MSTITPHYKVIFCDEYGERDVSEHFAVREYGPIIVEDEVVEPGFVLMTTHPLVHASGFWTGAIATSSKHVDEDGDEFDDELCDRIRSGNYQFIYLIKNEGEL